MRGKMNEGVGTPVKAGVQLDLLTFEVKKSRVWPHSSVPKAISTTSISKIRTQPFRNRSKYSLRCGYRQLMFFPMPAVSFNDFSRIPVRDGA
jgi:hypothetical protein